MKDEDVVRNTRILADKKVNSSVERLIGGVVGNVGEGGEYRDGRKVRVLMTGWEPCTSKSSSSDRTTDGCRAMDSAINASKEVTSLDLTYSASNPPE